MDDFRTVLPPEMLDQCGGQPDRPHQIGRNQLGKIRIVDRPRRIIQRLHAGAIDEHVARRKVVEHARRCCGNAVGIGNVERNPRHAGMNGGDLREEVAASAANDHLVAASVQRLSHRAANA